MNISFGDLKIGLNMKHNCGLQLNWELSCAWVLFDLYSCVVCFVPKVVLILKNSDETVFFEFLLIDFGHTKTIQSSKGDKSYSSIESNRIQFPVLGIFYKVKL